MDQFGWGAEFLRVNADVLETYAACADGAEVVKAQVRRHLKHLKLVVGRSPLCCVAEVTVAVEGDGDYGVGGCSR